MTKKRHTGAFVAGSLVGGLAAAAITLWKTPKSGQEWRESFGGGADGRGSQQQMSTERTDAQFSNPVLSFVEKTVAPMLGVELGKLAKDDPDAVNTAPVRRSAADARPPQDMTSSFTAREPAHDTATAVPADGDTLASGRAGMKPVAGEPVRVPPRDDTAGRPAVNPEEEATHNQEAGSDAPAATTEDLTHPTPEYAEQLREEQQEEQRAGGNVDFPDPPGSTERHR